MQPGMCMQKNIRNVCVFMKNQQSAMCLPGNIHLGSRGRQSSHIWKYDCSLPYIIFLFSPLLRLNHRSDEIDDRMSFYLFNVSPTCWHKCLCFYFYEDYSVLSENMHPKVAAVCMSMPCHSTCEHTKHGISQCGGCICERCKPRLRKSVSG